MAARDPQFTSFQLSPKALPHHHHHLHHQPQPQLCTFTATQTTQYSQHSQPATSSLVPGTAGNGQTTPSITTNQHLTLSNGLNGSSHATSASPIMFNLQDIIAQYHGQPDLLKLILTSKVEEDKRKAEEAKLRAKELDLLLLERERQRRSISYVTEVTGDVKNNGQNPEIAFDDDHSVTGYSSSNGSLNGATTASLMAAAHNVYTRSLNSSHALQNISLDSPTNQSPSPSPSGQPPPHSQQQSQISNSQQEEGPFAELNGTDSSITTGIDDGANIKRKRKRREMLPVTMIIEAKEFPYLDEYLWKNNGNTIQKKTGNKSTYYKCSNSNKGCPVNKTVTEKDGQWIIKYRGEHLEECGKIRRITC